MKRIIFLGIFALLAVAGVMLTSPSVNKPEGKAATIAVTSVAASDSLAAAGSSGARLIKWQSSGYPTNLGVNVNLIRKASSSPESFVLVRQIAANTENDGELLWIPQSDEKGSDLFIEVTCASDTGDAGCTI
ncbi:MAG TPA: hypothetical protein VIR98_02155, partial [Candidatus Paceibacterota bacterium]